MLKEEAVWLGRQLESLDPAGIYPMCNLGSASWDFRTAEQPYIDTELFARPRARGNRVVHVDIQSAPGVDVVADLSDESSMSELSQICFKSVMCCNLLEHVVDRQRVANLVMSLVSPGGYIIASVPYDYPYHEYPIDTMYRPQPAELARLFHETEIINSEIVHAGCFDNDMKRSWKALFWLGVRLCLPFYRPRRWLVSARYVSRLWRGYQVTCVILRRPLSDDPTKDGHVATAQLHG